MTNMRRPDAARNWNYFACNFRPPVIILNEFNSSDFERAANGRFSGECKRHLPHQCLGPPNRSHAYRSGTG
jgi:hypothetical protein